MNICEKFNGIFLTIQKIIFKKAEKVKLNEEDKFYLAEMERKRCEILEEIEEVKSKLKHANTEFNSQTDFDLIESCIYNIESLETRYNYLIKEARKQKIRCDAKVVCVTG